MDLGLRGRKAIVTGATKGIGRAIAEVLAAEGCDIGICARDAGEVEAAVAALSATGVAAAGSALDVADGDALNSWVGDMAARLGGLDIVVANVSALAIAPDEASWRRDFDIDVMHTVRVVEAALPHMEKSDAGAIVVISSVSGVQIDGASGPYGAMKAALIHYTAGLSRRLAPVTKLAAGLARKATALAISPGRAMRPMGLRSNASLKRAGSLVSIAFHTPPSK